MKSKLKNYQISTRLGSGSYGVIFKAINKSDKSECVLKQIRMNKMSQKNKKSTLNQATIMGKLIHPFIVQYKQSFVEDDTLHIVMEYCNNGDMSMYLKLQNKKPLKQQKIWKFFLQICLGLEYIHKNKILHRDIKTLNIFLNKNQDVKIGDLGVAKMLASNDFAQTIVGTPFYLSPQLCQQKPYNQKSDIWALGCLLYQLCTYKHPFEAANQASLILKIIRGKYSPIPQFYSKQLKDMIDMCLQRDYKRRPTATIILQRPKIREYIQAFKLEEKIKEQYERIKLNKQNKKPDVVLIDNKVNANVQTISNNKLVQQKSANQANKKDDKIINLIEDKTPHQSNNKKPVQQKNSVFIAQKKPTVSGMPQKNIILPDKQKIIQKLQPKNIFIQQKKVTPQHAPLIKHQQSQKKFRQNKQQFLKNLQKAVQYQNLVQRKSPPKKVNKSQSQQISTSVVLQQKSRLQKIDMKIQQQLKKQHQLQKQRLLNQRKKVQTPNLLVKSQQKNLLFDDRKSAPALIPKQSSKQVKRYQKVPSKITQSPLIPPLPPKNKQQIIKIKMEQPPVASKVFDLNNNKPNQMSNNDRKSKGIIKSKGFTHQIQQEQSPSSLKYEQRRSDFKQRKSSQNIVKPVLFGLEQQHSSSSKRDPPTKQLSQYINKSLAQQYLSQRNIKADASQLSNNENSRIQSTKKQPQRYLFKKKPPQQNIFNSNHSSSQHNRVRKGSSSNQLSRNAKNVSKYSQVTKQDEDCVMNLPDSFRNQGDNSSDEENNGGNSQKDIKMNKKFQLKQINNDLVLQKYEQILSSKSIGDSKNKSNLTKIQNNQQKYLQQSTQSVLYKQKPQQKPIKINKNLNQYDQQKNKIQSIELKNSKKQHFFPQQQVNDQQFDKILANHKQKQQQQHSSSQQSDEYIEQNESLALKTQNLLDQQKNQQQIFDQSGDINCEQVQIDQEYNPHNSNLIQEQIYQINKFNLSNNNSEQNEQQQSKEQSHEPSSSANNNKKQHGNRFYSSDRINQHNYNENQSQSANTQLYNQSKSQWSFDQQPQLPMLQQIQYPYFQQANPYLIPQQEEQKLQQKRNYLQIRLEQNIKRQDEINKLMQIKIQECKTMINPKYFDQILEFFRKMLKKEDQYTQKDENEVDSFLKKKGLTDQRKFQNIYKIMHFQMELENTRRIIQTTCKNLSDLQQNNRKQID